MKKQILLFVAVVFAAYANAQTYLVGHKSINFKDASRTGGFTISGGTVNPPAATGRNMGTEVYYPATAAGDNTPVAPGNFPVIVFGHGFAMGWDSYTTLWDSMVRNGYIICFPRTEGSLLPAPSHGDFGKDLAKVADLMLAGTSPLAGSTNSRVAIGGHSMGGGATFLADQYTTSPACYFTFAAAETNPKASLAAKNITKPHLIFSGTYDCVAPTATNQTLMYDSLSSACKTQINLTKAYHCAFADNNFNCGFGEGTCITSGGLSSAEQQRRVRLYLNPYLDYYLKGVCSAWFKFENLIDTVTIATIAQVCNNLVAQNASITGSNSFCQGGNTVLNANPSGFNYVWSDNSTASTLTASAAGSYSVVVGNGTCSLSSVSVSVIENLPPATPSAITANDTVCSNISNLNISVTNDATATQYNWTLPNGWSITNGNNTNAIQVSSGTGGGTISVTAENNCGTTSPVTKSVTVVPSNLGAPGLIAGEDTVCEGISYTYAITAVSGADSYLWTTPNSWSVASISPDSTITYNIGSNSGIVTVAAVNGCGQSSPSQFVVTVNTAPSLTGSTIAGPDTICTAAGAGIYYTLNPFPSTNDDYNWTIPNGWSFVGSSNSSAPIINVNSSGAITVNTSNSCGNSNTISLNVVVLDTNWYRLHIYMVCRWAIDKRCRWQ